MTPLFSLQAFRHNTLNKAEFFYYFTVKFNLKSKSKLEKALQMFSWQSIFTVRIFLTCHNVEVIKIADVLEELATYSFKK
jgi:hypothetical protein